MKKILMTLLLALFCIHLYAEDYQVNVKSTLNVRSQPSATAPLLGKLPNGTRISDVHMVDNGWAEFDYNGQTGYVKSAYLTTIDVGDADKQIGGKSKFSYFDYEGPLEKKWMTFVVLGCIAIMWFLCKFVREVSAYAIFDSGSSLTGWMMVFNCCLTIFTSLYIIHYTIVMGNNALWFLFPSVVHGPLNGWLYTILNFIFFIYALVNLLVNYIKTMNDFSHQFHLCFNIRFGLIGWGIGIIGLIVCSFIGNDEWTQWVLIFTGAWQLIQIIIIWVRGWNGNNFIGLLAATIVYIIGALGIVVFAIPATLMLFVLIVVGGLLSAFVNSNENPSKTRPGTVPYGHQVVIHHNGAGEPYYHDDDGNLRYLNRSGNTYTDNLGNSFDENGYSNGWN